MFRGKNIFKDFFITCYILTVSLFLNLFYYSKLYYYYYIIEVMYIFKHICILRIVKQI